MCSVKSIREAIVEVYGGEVQTLLEPQYSVEEDIDSFVEELFN